MIQDIFPKKYDNNYYPNKEPKEESVCFVFRGNQVMVGHERGGQREIPQESASALEQDVPAGDIFFPPYRQLKEHVVQYRYLFCIDGEEYFLVQLDREDEEDETEGFRYEHYKALRHAAPKYRVFALMTAYHLYCWYRDSRICGRCGTRTGHDRTLRAMRCPKCQNLIFPRISPAVIVGVYDKEHMRLLMTRYNGRDYKGYALIAGFVEIGESAEDTVRREVFEETGIHVKNIVYYASQPWGMDSNLLLGYYAELEGGTEIKLDTDELSMAQWYAPEEITVADDDVSLTSRMIANWKHQAAKTEG